MIEYFDQLHTRESRAVQIWQILVGKAYNRQTMTYGELAGLLDFKGAGVLAQLLGPIMFYCEQNGLPPLTILVVNEKTGSPGIELSSDSDENTERENVFKHDWYNIYPPTEEDYAEANRTGLKE